MSYLDLYLGVDPGVQNLTLVTFSPSRNVVATWKPKGAIPPGVRRLCFLMQGIKGHLAEIDKIGKVRQVAMEGYSMAERYGQHASGEVGAAIKLALVTWWGIDNRVAYPTIVAASQLKKFTTGSGAAKKSMMAKEVFKRWSTDFDDENLAEAYALARVAWAVSVRPEMTKAQQEVVKALEARTEWSPLHAHTNGGRRRFSEVVHEPVAG